MMKHRICKLLALTLMLTAVLLLAACGGAPQATTAAGIKVQLIFPEGSATVDATEVTIAPGGTAQFALTVAEGYEYVGNDNQATYADGYLTLVDVRFPTTITVDIRLSEDENIEDPPVINFDALDWSYAAKGGTASSTVAAGTYPKDTSITVTATASEGYTFLGWSEGAYLTEQGKLVSENVSYTFALAGPTTLYANFKSDGEAIIRYHLNDAGVVIRSATMIADLRRYMGDNTPVLIELPEPPPLTPLLSVLDDPAYSLDADCFLYEENESGTLTVIGLTELGKARTELTVPAMVNGKVVAVLGNGGTIFAEASTLKTITVNENITYVSPGSLDGCPSLKTVVLNTEPNKTGTHETDLLINAPEALRFRAKATYLISFTTDYYWSKYASRFDFTQE